MDISGAVQLRLRAVTQERERVANLQTDLFGRMHEKTLIFFLMLFDFLSHFHFSEDDEVIKWSKL